MRIPRRLAQYKKTILVSHYNAVSGPLKALGFFLRWVLDPMFYPVYHLDDATGYDF